MTYSIALAGKGGTGKTTVAGMLIKYLVKNGKGPVLAVDADSNANLNEVLGLEVADTLGNAREEMKKGIVPGGMTKDVFMSMKLEQAVVEDEGYDLVVMGQPEGSGCYCAANTLLTGFLERLTGNYPYVVMDNEAGMEHLSRRTTQDVHHLFVVSDPTMRGIVAAERIVALKDELEINVENTYLILNRLPGEIPPLLQEKIDSINVPFLGIIPMDEEVMKYDFSGIPLVELGDDSLVYQAVEKMLDQTLGL